MDEREESQRSDKRDIVHGVEPQPSEMVVMKREYRS